MASPRRFTVIGPLEVPTTGGSGHRSFDIEGVQEFWRGPASAYSKERGCYVFALRRGRGYCLLYVGRTSRQTFEKECFTPHKYQTLHRAMRGEPGTLVLFLLKYERTRGRLNSDSVQDLEKFLIGAALRRSPNLANKQYSDIAPSFAIEGLQTRGRPKSGVREFKRALGL